MLFLFLVCLHGFLLGAIVQTFDVPVVLPKNLFLRFRGDEFVYGSSDGVGLAARLLEIVLVVVGPAPSPATPHDCFVVLTGHLLAPKTPGSVALLALRSIAVAAIVAYAVVEVAVTYVYVCLCGLVRDKFNHLN